MAHDLSRPDPKDGQGAEKKGTTLAEFMGSDFANLLTPKLKTATWEDVLQAAGFAPDKNSHQNPLNLAPSDITDFKNALVKKFNWHYDPGINANSCCSCVP